MVEQQQSNDKLERELEILTEYQSRSKAQAEAQRNREIKELEERVDIRKQLLEKKVIYIIIILFIIEKF